MKNKFLFYIAILSLLVTAYPVDAQNVRKSSSATRLLINQDDSRVNWSGKNPAGEHHGFIKLSGGEIWLDNNEILRGSFILDMNSITVIDITDESNKSKLVGHLKSPDFFDVARYPAGQFEITRVTKLKVTSTENMEIKATHKMEGNLTLKGITRKISFNASINVLNGKLTASTAPFTINRTEWGVNYQSRSLSAGVKDQFIEDGIVLTVELVTK
jgi:polyisoprenoid-binding protein YceI